MRNHDRVIVVGVDGSPDSDQALGWAITHAGDYGAGLHLVHALPLLSDEPPFWRAEDQVHRELAEQVLADARARARSAGVRHTSRLLDQPVAPALIDAGRHALMVVIGARGHGTLAGMLLGSVSQHVSRNASCPVVVVRRPAAAHASRVVVGVDGSPADQAAIEFAIDTASRRRAPLVAIHAWHHHGRQPRAERPHWATPAPDEGVVIGQRVLAEALAGWAEKYPDVNVVHEAIPVHPIRVLTDASERAALVVVGARGRGELTGMRPGSVSQAVLHHARSPVAIVH